MSLKPEPLPPIPEQTARVARTVCPKGSLCLWIGDELSAVFQDELFAALFPRRGPPAEAPWRLALVTVLQCVEGLSDRQAAEAVRTRIDWKYALRLELEDLGFDFSVLCEFRSRLLQGGGEALLFEKLLAHAKEQGWLKARGRGRTDSTHVLAAIETRRPAGMCRRSLAPGAECCFRPPLLSGSRRMCLWNAMSAMRRGFQDYRLPSGRQERQDLAEMIGQDGRHLFALLDETPELSWVRNVPAVETLRRVWVQQFYANEDRVRWRACVRSYVVSRAASVNQA
jgi:transposase